MKLLRTFFIACAVVFSFNVSTYSAGDANTLGLTPKEYANEFNGYMKLLDKPIKVKINLQKGQVNDVFRFQFNETNIMLGTVNKKGEILELTYFGIDSGAIDTAELGIVAMASTQTTNNLLPNLETFLSIYRKIFEKYQNNPSAPAEAIHNNVKYSFLFSEITGGVFLAEPIK